MPQKKPQKRTPKPDTQKTRNTYGRGLGGTSTIRYAKDGTRVPVPTPKAPPVEEPDWTTPKTLEEILATVAGKPRASDVRLDFDPLAAERSKKAIKRWAEETDPDAREAAYQQVHRNFIVFLDDRRKAETLLTRDAENTAILLYKEYHWKCTWLSTLSASLSRKAGEQIKTRFNADMGAFYGVSAPTIGEWVRFGLAPHEWWVELLRLIKKKYVKNKHLFFRGKFAERMASKAAKKAAALAALAARQDDPIASGATQAIPPKDIVPFNQPEGTHYPPKKPPPDEAATAQITEAVHIGLNYDQEAREQIAIAKILDLIGVHMGRTTETDLENAAMDLQWILTEHTNALADALSEFEENSRLLELSPEELAEARAQRKIEIAQKKAQLAKNA